MGCRIAIVSTICLIIFAIKTIKLYNREYIIEGVEYLCMITKMILIKIMTMIV